MKNIFKINCPCCKTIITIYVVDKEDEVNGIKVDEVVFEEREEER